MLKKVYNVFYVSGTFFYIYMYVGHRALSHSHFTCVAEPNVLAIDGYGCRHSA